MKYVETLYENNKCLVHFVRGKFNKEFSNPSLEDEFVMSGFEGLSRACVSYDGSTKFSTFAVHCIKNSMLGFLRSIKRHNTENTISLNDTNRDDSDEFIDEIEDTSLSTIDKMIDNESVQEILASLIICANEREQKIFIENIILKEGQDNISKNNHISQSHVSRMCSRIIRDIRKIMLYMSSQSCVPNIYNYLSMREYRKDYAKYFINKCKNVKIRNYSLNENDLVSGVFNNK